MVIGQEEDKFYVYCGNKIFNKDVENIQVKIDEISGLDKDQLKALYKERREKVDFFRRVFSRKCSKVL